MMIHHLSKLVYKREPSCDEASNINLMLEIGKAIPEILSSLRALDLKIDNSMESIEPDLVGDNLGLFSQKSQFSCMGTPLEKHFHEYVSQ